MGKKKVGTAAPAAAGASVGGKGKKTGISSDFYEVWLGHLKNEEQDQAESDLKKASSLYGRQDLLKVMMEWMQGALEESGFEECHFWGDIRIGIAFIVTCLGGYTWQYLKFPDDQKEQAYAVGGFFLLWVIVNIVDSWFVGLDTFMTVRPPGSQVKERLSLSISMEEYSEDVHITVTAKPSHLSHGVKSEFVQSVGKYFDEDGFLVEENLFNDFMALMHSHAKAHYGEMGGLEYWRAEPDRSPKEE